jgi:hypothetical protein
MKKLSTYLFLILFSFQTSSWANDISDFEIEGMSIGDSLLDYFSEEEINRRKGYLYPSKKFKIVMVAPNLITSNIYDFIQIVIKPSDKKYKIYAIDAGFDFHNDLKGCYKKMDEVVTELSEFFKDDAEKKDAGIFKHNVDESGKTTVKSINFNFDSGDIAHVGCTDWNEKLTKENQWYDNLKISIVTKEYYYFTTYEAHK